MFLEYNAKNYLHIQLRKTKLSKICVYNIFDSYNSGTETPPSFRNVQYKLPQ